MGAAFDDAPDRPEHIDTILNGLDRYNPETTKVFQDYVVQQCDSQTYDCYANLALLKLYQFNPHLTHSESITAILVKTLTVFPSPDFSLCLHLLPPSTLLNNSSSSSSNNNKKTPSQTISSPSALATSVQKLSTLNTLLSAAEYGQFWETLRSDDLYADLTAEVSGFDELMRVRIAATVSSGVREVERGILEEWLDLRGSAFGKFVGEVCGWKVRDGEDGEDGEGIVEVPWNKDNEAKGTVVRENVKFDQFSRIIRRAYEQPA